MPTLYILIGVPGSGKSTWLRKNMSQDGAVVSSDNHIENIAKRQGKTYDDVFNDAIKIAGGKMWDDAKMAFNAGLDIYWDQTNLTPKSRKAKLDAAPEGYRKVAVVFPTPDDAEHERRLTNPDREGKNIPDNVMKNMKASLTYPTSTEGFDEVQVVK